MTRKQNKSIVGYELVHREDITEFDSSRLPTIDDLVARVIKDALDDDCKLDARVEALKVVTTYHALTLKHRRPGQDEGDLTWDKIQREVHEAEEHNGRATRGR